MTTIEGPGKYGDVCEMARVQSGAKAVILVIFDGNKGHGMSVTSESSAILDSLPKALRMVADAIEQEQKQAYNQ